MSATEKTHTLPAETGGVWLEYDANLEFSAFFTHLHYSVNVAYYP